MTHPPITALTKDQLVAAYKALGLPPVDHARRRSEFYHGPLSSVDAAALAAAIPPKAPRKIDKRTADAKNALANAKEFRAIVRALASWGPELLENPQALAQIQDRAVKALAA